MTNQSIEGYALSPLQLHLWRLGSEKTTPLTARIRIQGALDAPRMQSALEEVSRDHEILRTAFPLLPGTTSAVQAISEEASITFESLALGDGDLDALEDALTCTPFDLANGEVLRATFVSITPSEHVLLLAQPPIAADAISLWNLARAVGVVLRGDPKATDGDDDGPMQVADVAQWLQENFESENARPGLDYWRSLDYPSLRFSLPMAFDRGGSGFHPECCARAWSKDDSERLERTAQATGTSAMDVLLATWELFLTRLADRDEIVIGFGAAGRGFEGLPDALGPFARFLPLVVEVDAEASFARLLRRTHETRLTAEDHAEVFEPERATGDSGHTLEYGFLYLEAVDPEVAGDLTLTLDARRATSEPYHMALVLDAGTSEPELALHFDPRHFTGADAAIFLEEFDTLLAQVLEDTEKSVGEFSLLSDNARNSLLDDYASEDASVSNAQPVHTQIAAIAQSTPDGIAVSADGRSLTYAELDASANRIARHLTKLGVGPGKYVGLYLDRSVEQIAAILGVFKSGAAYLPLPPGYPADRIAFMLEDTGAPVVLTRKSVAATLPSCGVTSVVLDDCPELEARDAGPLDSGSETTATLEDDAYVIFTSGSTGKPKGVPITHANLAHSTGARDGVYAHRVEAYLLLSSFAFDSSVAGIYWTLCQGGRLVLPPDGFEEEIPSISGMIQEHAITHMLALPSLYGVILESAAQGQLASLRTVVVAGESCTTELIRSHAERLPNAALYNEYGPTEGTVWSTVFDCLEEFERPSVPIGRPVPGASAYVVDGEGRLTPIGVAGELWIAGPGVARGYLGRPELTAERFVEAEFGGKVQHCYRTGDLVRFLPGGNIEFLGRIDNQVKIRGYRIELEEIDATLAGHPAVQEAVVLAREDSPGDQRLVAYVTLKSSPEAPDAATLREFLAGPLPDYMLPAHFVFLDDLPLLPNGKINRAALPAPDRNRSALSTAFVEPATPLERVLASIWGETLEIERVGAEDDFFELGGHSILATRLFARMVDLLQVNIPLRTIFDTRTPRGLSAALLADEAERERLERTAEIVVEVLEMPDEEG